MKTFSKYLVFFLMVSSFILPSIPIYAQAQEEEVPPFRWGVSATAGDWDPTIAPGWSIQQLWLYPAACDYPISGNIAYSAGADQPLEDELFAILATDWEFEYFPSENNSFDFYNSGGISAITYTLRENVTFHDGSAWNATAFKWNIDRFYIITGNLTGEGDLRQYDYYWPLVEKLEPYWTPGWNLSIWDRDSMLIEPLVTPNIYNYSGYFIGNETSYPGVTTIDDGWVRNPAPYGGWDTVGEAPINYAPYDRYPYINYVEIIDDLASGGTVKVHYNMWNVGQGGGAWVQSISYQAYSEHYTSQGIYGYENGVKDPRNPTIVDHMIGTGAWVYEYSDHDGGWLSKNMDYWNRSALEAEGLFDVERLEFINFPTGEAGAIAQNNALITHIIDAAGDSSNMPLDTQTVRNDIRINYFDGAASEYLTQITLNCINETYWAWPNVKEYVIDTSYTNEKGYPVNGIPQVLRRSICYAFNYDSMINALEGKAVKGGGTVGTANLYYNESVGGSEFNITYARELLLTTENDTSGKVYTDYGLANGYWPSIELYNFSKRTATRGLTASSDDNDWIAVAESGNPVWTVDFYWDQWHRDLKDEFETALKLIGVAISDPGGVTNEVPERIWDVVQFYWDLSFDGTHSIWSAGAWPMDFYMAAWGPEIWIDFMLRDNEFGTWRSTDSIWTTVSGEWFPLWNFGFYYDDEINALMDQMLMITPTSRKEVISKITDITENRDHPFLYAYEAKGGTAIWDCWEFTEYVDPQTGIIADYWGGFGVASMNFKGCPQIIPPPIPGFPIYIALLASMLGIAYVIMRRKKLK